MALALSVAALAALGSAIFAGALGRWVFAIPAVGSLIGALWLATLAPAVFAGGEVRERFDWIPVLGVELAFRIAVPQLVLALIVTSVGALIFAYCIWYFKDAAPPARTAGIFTAFGGSMLALVFADDVIVLCIAWELTTIFSYLLVGLNHRFQANRRAAFQALIVTTLGGLSMLAGMLMLGAEAGTLSLSGILADAPSGVLVQVALLLVLVGAMSKSAIVPFHFWLPGAMAAPTPVSAYLHAATMVKAGVFLVAVLGPAFGDVPWWRPLLVILGVVTMIFGAWRALSQLDIKLLLAHGTVSQLGFLVATFGIATKESMLAGLAMLAAHALFKAALFMVVGIVDHAAHTRDLRKLGGIGRSMPVVTGIAVLAAAAMAGLPPTLGFVAKESVFEAAYALTHGEVAGLDWLGWVAFLGMTFGSALTVAYSLRFILGTFFGAPRGDEALTRQPSIMSAFPLVLVLGVTVAGFLGAMLTAAFDPAVQSMPVGHESYLALWHGLGAPLYATLVSYGLGAVIWWMKARRIGDTAPKVMSAERLFQASVRGLDRLAVEVTAIAQPGSLPIYVSIILIAVVVLPGGALLSTGLAGIEVRPWDNLGQVAVGLVMVIAAVLAAGSRGRLKTFILVGVTGYGTALLFLMHGAPDVALTQTLAETAFLVLLVLVLRVQPKYFTNRPLRASRWFRGLLALAVGTMAGAAALYAYSSRVATPVSAAYAEASYEFGYGRNIVNVTLVDIRAWDTFGEVGVLVVAATGVASLLFIATRVADPRGTLRGDRGRPETGTVRESAWLRGGRSQPGFVRAPQLEVITRLLFPVVILVSFYLFLAGHNSPGGGFIGGIVAGLALAMRYLASGRDELAEAAPFDAGKLLGAGLVIAAGSLATPVFFGGRIGQSAEVTLDLPVLGEIHLVSSIGFDLGVYLIVIGALLDFIRSLGAGIDQHAQSKMIPIPRPDSDRARPARRTR